MNALRKSLMECKAILGKVPFLNNLIRQSKYIFAFGAFAWILGGLIPDTAHFAATLFSSLGRAAVFVGLFFTFVKGEEDRVITIISAIISVGALIIIIVELASTIYFASLESYIFLLFFFVLAVNSGKYVKSKKWYFDSEKDDPQNSFIDTLSHPLAESESTVHVETLSRKAPPAPPEASEPPWASHAQKETLSQKTRPTPPEAPEPPSSEAAQAEVPAETPQTTTPRRSKIQRVPNIGAAPTIGRAPSVRIKPKE